MQRPAYRHVRGGLDMAVKQAERRGLNKMFVFDADCHVEDPFFLLTKYLPKDWKKRQKNPQLMALAKQHAFNKSYEHSAPKGAGGLDPVKARLMMLYTELTGFSGFDNTNSGRIRRTELKTYDEKILATHGGEAEALHWPTWFPLVDQDRDAIVDRFTSRMKDIGISRSLVFPDIFLDLALHPDYDLEVAIANGYIDYMLDNFLGRYPEMVSPIFAPANSPEKAAELIERVGSEKGIVGVFASPATPTSTAGDEAWNPIYEAAQKKGLPICFHGTAVSVAPFDRFRRDHGIPAHSLSFPFYLAFTVASLVMEGVPERYPDLKFAFIEGGVTWIPWIMHRLDSEFLMHSSQAPLLKKLPSEYIKKFYFTSQPLEQPRNKADLEWIFRTFNAETQLMYASDYPHWDWDVPSVIYDLPFLSEQAKRNILGENAKAFFGNKLD